jgi:hypothetical protein
MIGRIQAAMKQEGFEYIILTHVQDTFYATGYMPPMPSAVSLVPAEGNAVLIVSTLESEAAASLTPEEVEVREVRSWVFVDDGTEASRSEKGTIIDPDGAAGVLLDILARKPLQGKIGLNLGIVGKRLWDRLTERLPACVFADCAQMLLDVRILTGRTHQIRVHLKSVHHPVCGDPLYGMERGVKVPCLMLHAYSLAFEHPRTRQKMTFQAPLPEDFLKGLKSNGVGIPDP